MAGEPESVVDKTERMEDEPERTFTELARRDQIVGATVSVLANEGFRKATIERIAEAAGISKALVLYHFTNKEELIRQTFFRVYEQLSELIGSTLDPDWPVDQLLREFVVATVCLGVEHADQHRALEQIIINRGIAETRESATISFAEKEPLYRAQEDLFRAGQQAGVLRDFDVRVMAITQQGAIDAMIRYLIVHPEADPEHHAQALADILLAAVRAS
jgi:AcrR family transcriptional regulator